MFFLQNELVKRGVEIEKLHELLDQQQRLALQDKKVVRGIQSRKRQVKSSQNALTGNRIQTLRQSI